MTDRYLYQNAGTLTERIGTVTSVGAGNAGEIVALDSDGRLNLSVLPPAIMPIVFVQPNPSAMWHIVHGQGVDPSLVVRRLDGVTIAGFGTQYSLDRNTVDVYFGGQPTAGEATMIF